MMRVGLWLGLLLLAGACAATNKHKEKHHPKHHHSAHKRSSEQFGPQDIGSIQVFEAGRDYCFDYNSQIATGYAPWVSTQRAMTRMESKICVSVRSLDQCVLRMDKIKIGQRNEEAGEGEEGSAAQILPMQRFQKIDRNTTHQMKEKLQLPVEFSYVDGTVERLLFSQDDAPYSKNIKKAVLNLLQINLKAGAQQQDNEEQVGQSSEEESQRDQLATAFTTMEATLEGECPTTYSVLSESDSPAAQDYARLNITKSINFHRCQYLADVAYGFQVEPIRDSEWPQKQQTDDSNQASVNTAYPEGEKLDTGVVIPKEKLDRSTVIRVVLSKAQQQEGGPSKGYGIERVELLSEYVVKSSRAESKSAMQTIAVAELVFTNTKEANAEETNIPREQEREERLIYDADEESQEKEFFMFGDDKFGTTAPFPYKDPQVVMDKAERHLQKLAEEFAHEKVQQNGGIDALNAVEHFEKLVALMRMCTSVELKQLDEKAEAMDTNSSRSTSSPKEENKVASDLFVDALAVAATRNTIALLETKIKELAPIDEIKAAQLLKVLGRGAGLPAPSANQVDTILGLCKSPEVTQAKMVLKQSCWLTFGTMVGELNMQKRKAKLHKDTQSPMKDAEQKVENHKVQLYQEVLTDQWTTADNPYEKVLALKSIGNAGLKSTLKELKPVIVNRAEAPIIRINAIDALRRLRYQVPAETIQSIVLPIYLNTKANPEVRMSAFSMVMQTRPSRAIIDQIVLTMAKEKSRDVQNYIYSTIKAAAQSPVPEDQKIADNLKAALKLVRISEEQLEGSSSRRWTSPFYSQDTQEGAFLNVVSMFSPDFRQTLPSHVSIGLDTYFNGQYNRNSLKMTLCQKDVEQLIKEVFGPEQDNDTNEDTNTSNSQGSQKPGFFSAAAEKLRSIFRKLKLKGRSNKQQEEEDVYQPEKQSPFVVLSFRLNDVDMAMIPLNMDAKEGSSTGQLKGLLKQTLRSLVSSNGQNKYRLNSAVVINSRASAVPTSIGLSLRMTQSMYLIGQLTTQLQSQQGGPKLKVHPNANWVQVQKMEVRTMVYRSGVRSTRAVALNLPIEAKFHDPESSYSTSSGQKRTKFSLTVPQKRTRLVSVQTMPTTFLKKVTELPISEDFQNSRHSQSSGHQQIQVVRDQQLESQIHEIHTTIGEKGFFGVPIKVHGHGQSPRRITSLKELLKVIMTGENHISVDIDPSAGQAVPKSISFMVTADVFRATTTSPASSIRPRLDSFYRKDDSFGQRQRSSRQQEEEDQDSSEETQNEMSQGRRSSNYQQQQKRKFNSYLERVTSGQQRNYKHTIQAWVETTGNGKTNSASAKIETVCDVRLRACQATLEAKRSPLQEESQRSEWKMDAQVQTLYPEYVSDVEELLDSASQQQQKFFCHAEAKWGQNGHQQQEIQLNIQGQPSQQILRSIHQQPEQPYRRHTASPKKPQVPFIDQYQMVADYKLKPEVEHYFRGQMEALKARNFWSTSSQMLQARQSEGPATTTNIQAGQLECSLNIEMSSGRYANVTIQSRTQLIKIRPLELPLKMRPMPLVRPHSRSQHHSTGEMFGSIMEQHRRGERVQCKVGPKTVDTFDGVAYKAPMSKCYTVLAKDCGEEGKSTFAVLMRSLELGGEEKKLKVITPNKEIVVEPRGQEGELRIRINEDTYEISPSRQPSQTEEQQMRQQGVELQSDRQNRQVVTVDVGSVAIKFNGKTAKIQISEDYKERQCGLCGNYNDDQEDELRDNDNQEAGDLKSFHRSYTLDDGECQQGEHRNFYDRQPSNAFSRQDEQQPRQIKPVERTISMEYNHKICFSLQPVKQCPEGWQPAEQGDEEAQQLLKRLKVQFTCLDRQSIEAKRIRKVVRRSGVAHLAEYQPSFVEAVVVPENCVQP